MYKVYSGCRTNISHLHMEVVMTHNIEGLESVYKMCVLDLKHFHFDVV